MLVRRSSKSLANFLFGSDDDLIQIDMGEFHDRFTASRLFGAPPGYVGYEEGGQLTEKVRRKPFSVVLFDEIEKAHKEIYNTLLQVLEDGRLTDGQGRIVDFKNTVLIFTSNLGTQDISKAVGLGFSGSSETDSDAQYERMKNKVNDELKKHFRPEFLNRIDEIVVFHQLTQEQIVEMVELLIGRVEKQLAERDMGIELTQKARIYWQSADSIQSWVLVRCAVPFSARLRISSPRRSSSVKSVLVKSSPLTWRTGTASPRTTLLRPLPSAHARVRCRRARSRRNSRMPRYARLTRSSWQSRTTVLIPSPAMSCQTQPTMITRQLPVLASLSRLN